MSGPEATDVRIRPFHPDDREALARITAASWAGVTMAELRERRVGPLEGRPWREHKTEAVLQAVDREPGWVLVADAGGTVVGYATYRIQGEVGTVADNAVDPDWQGRGIGSGLVAAVLERLRESGVRLLEVTTFVHDAPARAVYEKFGFEEVARSVHYAMPASPADPRGESAR